MQLHGINLVLDIGANMGQYAKLLRNFGYQGHIVSAEPHAATFNTLLQEAANDRHWTALNLAISDCAGDRELHVPQLTAGSSFHQMTPQTTGWIPEFAYVDYERVSVTTLDDLFPRYAAEDNNVLLKIDTQGHESQVLRGGTSSIPSIELIEVELTLQAMYKGQEDWLTVSAQLADAGFELISVEPVFVDPETAYMVQIDGIFRRRNSALTPEPEADLTDAGENPR